MLFDPDAIDRLSPEAREEVQDFYVRKHFADRHIAEPERRAPKLARLAEAAAAGPDAGADPADHHEERRAWPRVWYRNDSSRPPSSCSARAVSPLVIASRR